MTKAKTITISIPDVLSKRLIAVKDNIKNLSAVCQEAIEREVTHQELLLKEDEDMESVIKRLKSEKEKYDEQHKEHGYKDGFRDAKKMSYVHLMDVIKGEENFWFTKPGERLQDRLDEIQNEDAAFDDDMYVKGWQEGVKAFWEEVKSKL